jgi:hypothetical protein
MLSGQRQPIGHDLHRCALEDDLATVVTGARAKVDDLVGVCHHRLLVLDHDDRPT